jgi:hypothetical protein
VLSVVSGSCRSGRSLLPFLRSRLIFLPKGMRVGGGRLSTGSDRSESDGDEPNTLG